MGYYLVMIGQRVMGVLMLFLFLYACCLFAKSYSKFVFTDVIFAFRPSFVKGKWKLVLLALLLMVVYGGLAFLQTRQIATVSIALTYPEASSGLNPNGTRYNMSEALSDEVLERAIEFGGFTDITVDDLQNSLDIVPRNGAGLEGTVSTQFFLTFRNTGHTGSLDSQEILHAVASAYRDWFIEKYSVNYDVLDISFDDIENYDYPDMTDYLRNAVTTICNYASAYADKTTTYRSPSTQETFQSISQKGWDIHDTGMESLESFILSRGLSKDEASYLSKLRYEFTDNCNIYQSNIRAYDVRIEAIEKYDNDMATVVYIPTYDTDNTFYMSKTKIGIDHFSADADSYSSVASSVLSILQDDKYLMQQLRANLDDASSYSKADGMVAELQQQILDLAEKTKQTVQDYVDDTYNGYMTISRPLNQYSSLVVGVLIYGCIFFGLLYIIRAFKLLEKRNRKTLRRDGI